MRTLVYILMGAILLALAMVVTGPHIKASGTAYRASHRMISDARPSPAWSAQI
jgi:hypothetical protein